VLVKWQETVDNATATASDRAATQVDKWESTATKMTADSYATEPEDVLVKVWSSNGDGTFSSVDTTEYSALHHKSKAETAEALVAPHYTAIEAVSANEVNVNKVADVTSDVTTVAASIADVSTVAAIDDAVISLADIKIGLDSLYADKTTLDSLYTDKATLDNVASNLPTIVAVNDNETNINDAVNVTVPLLLSRMNIDNMVYTDGNLTKIEYAGTDNYEDFSYNKDGNLSTIKHTKDGVLAGSTAFNYDTDGNLVSSIFTEA